MDRFRVWCGNQNDRLELTSGFDDDYLQARDMEHATERAMKQFFVEGTEDLLEERAGDRDHLFLDLPYGPEVCDCSGENEHGYACDLCTAVLKWVELERMEE